MDPYGKEELIRFYDQRLFRFGDSHSALHWKSNGQRLRYGFLCDIAGDLSGLSVLDFGCGKGDLYHFLRERTDNLRYCGIDVNEGLVELARKKDPGAEFLCVDIEETPLDRAFDVVLICGVFNLRIAGIAESMKSCLRRLFPLCRKALHLNAPSADAPWKDLLRENKESLERFGIRRLALFGSRAREDAQPGSDLDFLVEFEKKSFDAYMDLKFFLEELFGASVDLVLTNTLKPRLRDRILEEAVDVQGL